MEQSACSHGPRPSTTGTITVAELLARCAGVPAPPPRPAGPAGAVSVAALLRREGRGPHVADRPLVPRGHARIAQPPPAPPRHNVRNAAVAAGALFAATAVLAPSVVEDAAGRRAGARDTGIPLPPTEVPLAAGYDWSGTAAPAEHGTGETEFAAMRQVLAEGIPSQMGSTGPDRLVTEPAPGGQYLAAGFVQTPDRARAGSTGPTVTPESGTIPPGGAGTPPGGTWSPGAGPPDPGGSAPDAQRAGAQYRGVGGALTTILAVLPSGGTSGDGPPADQPGDGPPAHTTAAARSHGGAGDGAPKGTAGDNAPAHGDGDSHRGDTGKANDDLPRRTKAASARKADSEGSTGGKGTRKQAAADGSGDSGESDRPARERSDAGSSEKAHDERADDKSDDKGRHEKSSHEKSSHEKSSGSDSKEERSKDRGSDENDSDSSIGGKDRDRDRSEHRESGDGGKSGSDKGSGKKGGKGKDD